MRWGPMTMNAVGVLGVMAAVGVAYGESFLEDFENPAIYPIGWHLRDTDPWWGQSGTSDDPIIQAGAGVGGSVGLSAAARNFHWVARPFEWKDPTIAGVIIRMDFQTPGNTGDSYWPFRDKIGWTTNQFSTDSAEWLQIELYKNQIRGSWKNASGSDRTPTIVTYDVTPGVTPMTANTFYRAAFKLTKLTMTSAKIDVSLHTINPDGTTGSEVISGTIADTDALGSDTPNPALFTAPAMWPTYRNYNNGASAKCDNAYFEIIRISAPDCFSKVTPEEAQGVETDINAAPTPSSINYTVQNLGLNTFTYTVVELDDQQQPVDVSWISINKTGATVAAQTSDTLTVNFNSAGLAGGSYTAYLKFTDDCDPAVDHIRQINLSVYGCRWTLDSCSQERAYLLDYPAALPEDVVYRITNTGAYPFNYSVAKSGSGSCFEWLVVMNPTGSVAVGEYVDVVAHIDVAALAGHDTDEDYECTLTFTDNSSPQVVTRDVKLRYLGVGDTQVFMYDGSMLPTNDDSAGPGLRFDVDDGEFNGAVEPDPDADNHYVWRLIDPGNDIKTWYRAKFFNPESSNWERVRERGSVGSTILARIKLRSWGPAGSTRRAMLRIAETDASAADFHWGGLDGVAAETKRGVMVQTGMGTDGFVTLRLTSKGSEEDAAWDCGRIVRLYLNENPTPVIEIINAMAKGTGASGDRGFWFGDSNGDQTIDIAFDWVSGTNAGAFAPGEEVAVLGKSLVPAFGPGQVCNVPFADTDGDGDVDQTDFAAFQRCYMSSPFDWDNCHCLDRAGNQDVIDSDDLWAFEACATGPGVAFDVDHPPENCVPY